MGLLLSMWESKWREMELGERRLGLAGGKRRSTVLLLLQ